MGEDIVSMKQEMDIMKQNLRIGYMNLQKERKLTGRKWKAHQ